MAWCVLRLRREEQPPTWRVAANILNKQLRTANKGWSSSLGVGEVLTILTVKTDFVANHEELPRTWIDTLVRPKHRKRGMRFGTWNVKSLYRAGSLTAAARELGRYKLDLVHVQEVRWDNGGTVRAGDCNIFYGNGNHHLRTDILYTTEQYQQFRE